MTDSGTTVISNSLTTSGSIVTEESVTIFYFCHISNLSIFIHFDYSTYNYNNYIKKLSKIHTISIYFEY